MCRCSNRTMWFMVLSSVNQFDLFWDWWAKIHQGNYCLGLYIVDVWEKISLIIWTSGVTIAVFVACRVLLSVRAATLVVRKGSWLISMRSLSIGLFPGPFWDRRLLKGSPGVHVMNHDGQGGESFKYRGFRSCFRWELVLDFFPVHHLLMLNFLLMHVHRAFCAVAWCMCIQQPSAQDVPSQKR